LVFGVGQIAGVVGLPRAGLFRATVKRDRRFTVRF
jgi:hypothetical protein